MNNDETVYCNPLLIGALELQKNCGSTLITGTTKEEIKKELKTIFDNQRLNDKVNLTREQINQIGLDTLKRYAEQAPDKPIQYLEL